ncbi:MAG: magnesium/cobalt transporter CorA [Flavobacteriales bacterium]
MENRSDKKGQGPGSLIHIGEHDKHPIQVRMIDYSADHLEEGILKDISICEKLAKSSTVSWIDVDGIYDAKLIETIGNNFDIHILLQEDIMNSESRPKVEFFDDYMFVTLKMLELKPNGELNVEQLSLITGDNYLLMFQERPGDSFEPIRERIRTSKGKVRGKDAYYLAYLILDVVIDNYILVSEQFSHQIEELENAVVKKPSEITLQKILRLRQELLDFKRSIDPLKEAINTITKELPDDISKYYRDLHDHIIYESENLGVYREMLVNLLDLYHSSLGMKMNQIMKVLTVITTIFVPLTFIVGVFGMNFEIADLWTNDMFRYVMFGMLALVLLMLFFFKRKRWI